MSNWKEATAPDPKCPHCGENRPAKLDLKPDRFGYCKSCCVEFRLPEK
jgi:hypothetical protein